MLGALGGGLGAAHADPDLAAERRYAADDGRLAGAARLFAGLAADAGWVRRYADLDRARAELVRRRAAFAALAQARRDAALFGVAVDVLAGAVPEREADDAAAEALAVALGVRVPAGAELGHLAPWLGGAARVRGTFAAVALAATLRDRFDEDWWRNPRAGSWLVSTAWAGGAGAGADAGAPDEPGAAAATARAFEAALG